MPGPESFTTPIFRHGIWLEGNFFRDGQVYPSGFPIDMQLGPISLETLGKTHITQSMWLGGEAPITLQKIESDMDFWLVNENDYWIFMELTARGVPIQFYPDLPISDQWYIPGGADTQTDWQTSRMTPWGSTITGITKASRVPTAFKDSTPLTVVEGTPSTGEIKIPDTGGDYETFVTGDDAQSLNADFLKVRYHPILLVLITRIRMQYRINNGIRFTATILEQLGNTYA
jgi:hypothetical protein